MPQPGPWDKTPSAWFELCAAALVDIVVEGEKIEAEIGQRLLDLFELCDGVAIAGQLAGDEKQTFARLWVRLIGEATESVGRRQIKIGMPRAALAAYPSNYDLRPNDSIGHCLPT